MQNAKNNVYTNSKKMSDSFTDLRLRLPKPEAFHQYDRSPPPSSQGGRPRTRRASPTVKLHRQLARDAYWCAPASTVWARFVLSKLRRQAKLVGVACDLTKDDLLDLLDASQMQCPAFHVDLVIGRGAGHVFLPNAAAVDRVDHTLPFTKSNMLVLSAKAKAVRAILNGDEMQALATFAQEMKGPHHA